jgi:hypothetical protein
MRSAPTRTLELDRIGDVVACDAFSSRDDDVNHAVLLQKDGTLSDLTYDASGTRGRQVIGIVPGALDVTAFWSQVNDVRNVIVVTDGGSVWHFMQEGVNAWTRTLQRTVSGALRIAGYDDHHHGIVLTSDGEITDQPFHAVTPAVAAAYRADIEALSGGNALEPAADPKNPDADKAEQPIVVAEEPTAIDIAALWAEDQNRFVIVAEASGAVIEIGYGQNQPASRRELTRLPGLRCVNSCYANDPAMGRCVVALTEAGDIYALHYGIDVPNLGDTLISLPSTDVACYPTPDGQTRVVLVSADRILDLALPH